MTKDVLTASLAADIDTEDRIRVLGVIDQFRTLGVNEDVSLPQLVVVGDQSSGKSSLLEGLTGLSFPIASELCTRFATQIVLKRSADKDEQVCVSIIPGPAASSDEKQKKHLESFASTLQAKELDGATFKDLLDKAAEYMGLPTSRSDSLADLEKRFSDDVLKIEISGPSHHHLSVVDVPGLFHNPTKFQTEEDLKVIRDLLQGYITDSRTIILAVMDARNNLANQEVFRMARAADPEGKRTVGIITKCDALQKGDEDMVLQIAQNLVERLNHGWFVVKNRSTQDIQNNVTIKQRHKNEHDFFKQAPWTALEKDRIGIHHLKKFLGRLLYDHIRSEFPTLVEEIRNLVSTERAALDTLGPSRQTTQQQRQYLSRLSGRYQGLVADCLRGNYETSWNSDDHRKLRMHLHLANEEFARKLSCEGHHLPFQNVTDEVNCSFSREAEEENIYDWIRRCYRDSRGSELPGTVNPLILETMFKRQAKNWRSISEQHLAAVDILVSNFNSAAFNDTFVDESVRIGMENRNASFVQSTKRLASERLQTILQDEMGGILQTVNHYFAQNLDAARQDRVIARLKKIGLSEHSDVRVSLDSIRSLTCISNEDQAVYDIHDILKAYYKVARKRFADNVVTQVIEHYYVGAHGPLKQTSPEEVGAFTDDQLKTIAGETYATSTRRNELTLKLDRLEKALALAENMHL